MSGKITDYGFNCGSAKVTRCCSDPKEGWAIISVDTPRHTGNNALEIYVTKTGKVRIYDANGEWVKPRKK